MKYRHSTAGRPPPTDVQQAHLSLTMGKRMRLAVDVRVTPRGLLAIGGLVSAILLSTAALVHTARRPA
ncbi:hypothetical protein GCM10022268_05140 [Sphingomonas cynarae]|uniref:Uncharacterized protein n=1 Tax=Sphingomonas cynarae TaxID=930197 RepID=A0ABP7CZ28_9SPHN